MTSKGRGIARSALEKLLRKAERAWAQQIQREHTLVFSEASFPEYFKLPLREDKSAVHADLRNAERAGAIAIEWDRRAGEDGQIVRIRLVDAGTIADHIGETPAWIHYERAEALLQPWMAIPNIQFVLEKWRAGKQVRSMPPERASDFVDACKVIDTCQAISSSQDVPIRRLSATLFSDSKRIESIGSALDVLTAESMDAPWRDFEDVFSGLGLVKHPQPVLIAGSGFVELEDGTTLSVPKPYIGLAPQSIRRISASDRATYVLTVENLDTFHELALGKAGEVSGVIIYTAGMPSPAMLRVYERCVDGVLSEHDCGRWHWGDIDLGGFRIAACLARIHHSKLLLWSMDPTEHPESPFRKTLSSEEVREITRIASIYGWELVAEHVGVDSRAIEQEVLPLTLPPGASRFRE
jgi:hypothetical protein